MVRSRIDSAKLSDSLERMLADISNVAPEIGRCQGCELSAGCIAEWPHRANVIQPLRRPRGECWDRNAMESALGEAVPADAADSVEETDGCEEHEQGSDSRGERHWARK